MSTIDNYLFELQNKESVFPMDSISSGKLPTHKVLYGDSEEENSKEDNKLRSKEINQGEIK